MDLYLEKCLPHLRKTLVTLPWLHSHPFSWLDNEPIIVKDRIVRLHWYLNVVLVIAYSCFLLWRTQDVYLNPVSSLTDKMSLAFATTLYSICATFHIFLVAKSNSIVSFVRGYLKLLRDGSTGCDTSIMQKKKCIMVLICRLLLVVIQYMFWSTVAATTFLIIGRPTSPQFISSLTPEISVASRILGRLVIIVFHLYLALCTGQIIPVLACPMIFVMFSMHDLIQRQTVETTTITSGRRDGHDEGIHLRKTLRRYRCFQLTVNGFNFVYSSLTAFIQAGCTYSIVFALYVTGRAEGVFAVFSGSIGLIGLMAYVMVLSMYAEINNASNSLLTLMRTDWADIGEGSKSNVRSKLRGRELRALMELRVKAGSVFYFDKQLVLNFVDIVLGQTVDLLIMY